MRILKGLDHFARFGRPILATEFDVATTDEAFQADATRHLLTVMFSPPAVEGVTMWGFREGRHWKPEAALFRKDWSAKPNGRAWTDGVTKQWKQWWTTADDKAGTDGAYRTRGFLGDYEITARAGGKGKAVKATLEKDGTAATVTLEQRSGLVGYAVACRPVVTAPPAPRRPARPIADAVRAAAGTLPAMAREFRGRAGAFRGKTSGSDPVRFSRRFSRPSTYTRRHDLAGRPSWCLGRRTEIGRRFNGVEPWASGSRAARCGWTRRGGCG